MSNRRWYLWIPLLLISLGLTIWEPESSDASVVLPSAPRVSTIQANAPGTTSRMDEGNRELVVLTPRELRADFIGIFDVRRGGAIVPKAVSAPPPVPVVAPSKPTAPPLPLRFIGRLVKRGQPVLFLMWGERNLAMHIGDVADATYRLESIRDTEAEFTFLPLGVKQSLTISGGA